MADFTIDANGSGSFYENVGNNGTDDTVTVNIGPDFNGTITVDSQPADGEYDNTIINLPEGWKAVVTNLVQDGSVEDPAFNDIGYDIINADGISVGTLSIRANNYEGVPCFTRGTMILTDTGLRAVEDLAEGDLVMTRDDGLQPLRWVGSVTLAAARLAAQPALRPIRITAGALGTATPAQDLLVSPQHRVMVRSRIAQKMFGVPEVLVAAKQLLMLDGVDIAEDQAEVEYFHILFDRHEVVFSNGAETESLYTGTEALKAVGPAAREEIFALFPDLRDADFVPQGARILASGRQGRKLVMRHIQNHRQLVM